MKKNKKLKKELNNFVLGVDLDGVVADFYSALKPIVAEWLGVSTKSLKNNFTYGLREWGIKDKAQYEAIHRFAVTQRNLFSSLKPIKGAPSTLRKLSDLSIHIRIITHRLYINFFHKEAVSQTIDWLDNHGIPYRDLCFMKEKASVGADLYIEDSPENIKKLKEEGRRVIIFSNPTNAHLKGQKAKNWANAKSLILNNVKKWKNNCLDE